MSQQWDEFSKSLAEESFPRRESLRRLGAVFAGALFGSLGLKTAVGAPKTDPCTAFCKCSNKKARNVCIAACRDCGSDPTWLCGSCSSGYVCTDLGNDGYNCGACGYVCEDPGAYEYGACIDGSCVYACAEGADYCDGACAPVAWDPENCGECGNVCGGSTPYCSNGVCTECAPNSAKCGDTCTSLLWDNANCGACGVSCPFDTSCIGGFCEYQEPPSEF